MAERPEVSPPDITVVRGDPTAEELAALVAVLQTREAGAAAEAGLPGAYAPGSPGLPGSPGAVPSAWSAPAALHRRPLPLPSPGAWRRATP